MIQETLIALKNIGVTDEHTLDIIRAFEIRHEVYRRDVYELKRDLAVLKWMMPFILLTLLAVMFKAFTK